VPRVGGLDGCRGGWVLATVPARGPVTNSDSVEVEIEIAVEIAVVPHVDDVVRALEAGDVAAVAVDIPIGLADREPRACDRAARRQLGPRRSSVFPAPVRAVLGAHTYEETCEVSRRASGKGISKQLYNIMAKIAEVDAVQSPRLQEHFFEASPELSFAVMQQHAPMQHNKRSAAGRAERVAVLHEHFGVDVPAILETRVPGAQPDDVLDALALAWTARRFLDGSYLRLGGELDATGLRMEVIA
jgi:predicted RNase H-like nuclease